MGAARSFLRARAVIPLALPLVAALGCGERPTQRLVSKDGPRPQVQDITNQRLQSTQNATKQSQSDAPVTNLLAVWRSPTSTPEERAEALTKDLPRGASVESARALLGDDGRLVHYFGPSMEFAAGTNGEITGRTTGGHDYWQLEHGTPTPNVGLRFYFEHSGPNPGLKFDRAYPMRISKAGGPKKEMRCRPPGPLWFRFHGKPLANSFPVF